jgi:aspartate dehydrogenase
VGALDALRAAARGGLDDVFVEQRKAPVALLPDEPEIESARELFAGSAADAAQRFPTTMNIVAAVALAGVGFEKTRCRVVADPDVSGARVSVQARGAFGQLELSMDLVASSNAQTSALTAMSVVATLEGISAPMALLP